VAGGAQYRLVCTSVNCEDSEAAGIWTWNNPVLAPLMTSLGLLAPPVITSEIFWPCRVTAPVALVHRCNCASSSGRTDSDGVVVT